MTKYLLTGVQGPNPKSPATDTSFDQHESKHPVIPISNLSVERLQLIRSGSQAMANRTIYTRTYSSNSARQLVSGKGSEGDPLSDTAVLEEFRNHSKKWSPEPTALVSCSNRILDTLKRAFEMHYEDGESAINIWVAFMEVPSINPGATRIHSAKELAVKCNLPKPWKFIHEVVFEWAIPEKYIIHKVSLQTLMERELQEQYFLGPPNWEVRSTSEVRCYFAQKFPRHEPWEIGITLGVFAQKFGARGPLHWIAHQLFRDCVRARILDDDVVEIIYAHEDTDDPSWRPQIVDFLFFCDRDEGIDTSLCDWWLENDDLCSDYEEFAEWRDMEEDSITRDLIEFWETWHDFDCDGRAIELSAKERLAYDRARTRLAVEHENKRASIEAEAVKIGL